MNQRAAIIGVGLIAARPSSEHVSFKEMMFEAAQKATPTRASILTRLSPSSPAPRISPEGISIFEEYTPDQLGAVKKPMHTLTQDGLHGIADAVMQIRSGLVGLVFVEAHSKHSNLENPNALLD